jgi:hypothetical protein
MARESIELPAAALAKSLLKDPTDSKVRDVKETNSIPLTSNKLLKAPCVGYSIKSAAVSADIKLMSNVAVRILKVCVV